MDGKAFQLKQTEQYSIGKTFMGLIPCWVDAPSTLQPAHKYHGRNAVIMHENNGGFRCCFIDDEKATTIHLPENTGFVEGWRKKPAEWGEEDRNKVAKYLHERDGGMLWSRAKDITDDILDILRPHWKPSEEQMEALRETIDFAPESFKPKCTLESLFEQLKKL